MKNLDLILFFVLLVMYGVLMVSNIQWDTVDIPGASWLLSKNVQLILLGIGIFIYGKRVIDSFEEEERIKNKE